MKRRFQNDQELFEKYKTSIYEYIEKGYAARFPQDEVNAGHDIIFYLPYYAVFHPYKPAKVRVVFDCAAKFQGTSLNDQLLSGPDLTNSLVGVLTRFCEEPVALVSHVEGMFNQVSAKPEDYDTLRFLWWPDDDLSKKPIDYRMQAHLFGSTSSPSCANFCLRKTADDHKDSFDEEVVKTVKCNFYVDECLKSELSEITLERCIKPRDFGRVKSAHLHHFADASRIAFGTVSYIRLTNYEGKVHCAFLFGKSRLAYVKPMTIPRLELCAVVVAVQIDQMLRKELEQVGNLKI